MKKFLIKVIGFMVVLSVMCVISLSAVVSAQGHLVTFSWDTRQVNVKLSGGDQQAENKATFKVDDGKTINLNDVFSDIQLVDTSAKIEYKTSDGDKFEFGKTLVKDDMNVNIVVVPSNVSLRAEGNDSLGNYPVIFNWSEMTFSVFSKNGVELKSGYQCNSQEITADMFRIEGKNGAEFGRWVYFDGGLEKEFVLGKTAVGKPMIVCARNKKNAAWRPAVALGSGVVASTMSTSTAESANDSMSSDSNSNSNTGAKMAYDGLSNPKTGDVGITVWASLITISTLGVVGVAKFLKKVK